MAITIDWGAKVINVPQSYLTLVSGTLYELDVNQFHHDLRDIEDSEEGMPFLPMHNHVGETSLAGVTYAAIVEITNGYTVTFEDGQYTVRCVGANHNLSDVKNANQVSLIVGNSGGLIVAGSGVTAQDKIDIAEAVLDLADSIEPGITLREAQRLAVAAAAGVTAGAGTSTFYLKNPSGTKTRVTATTIGNNRTVIIIGDLS